LIKDQSIFPQVIILLVLPTFSLADCGLILFGRKLMFVTSWGLKGQQVGSSGDFVGCGRSIAFLF